MSKTFDEIQIGDSASHTKTITETDIVIYAGLTGDFNPMHVDAEYAKTTIFGERIAHGPIAIGLVAHCIGMQLPGKGCILLSLNNAFHKPVKIGDTITARIEIAERIEARKLVRMDIAYTNQRGETVATGDALVSPPRRKS